MAGQVLMGLPFYGYDFTKTDQPSSSTKHNAPVSANPIMGSAFLALLKKVKPTLKWEEKSAEHRVKYKVGPPKPTVHQAPGLS